MQKKKKKKKSFPIKPFITLYFRNKSNAKKAAGIKSDETVCLFCCLSNTEGFTFYYCLICFECKGNV